MSRGWAFVGGFVGAGALFWAVAFARRASATLASGDLIGTLALAAYLLTIQALLNAIAYALVAALVRGAKRNGRRVAAIDLCAGAFAGAMGWTGAWFGFVLPGLITGALAAVATRFAVKQ